MLRTLLLIGVLSGLAGLAYSGIGGGQTSKASCCGMKCDCSCGEKCDCGPACICPGCVCCKK